jgi:HEAT repeat protein
MRVADAGPFAAALSDADHRVRLRAVSGLVSTGEARLVAGAAADRSRKVRVAVADGLAALAAELTETGHADAGGALERLAGDPDVLVRAAAFKAAGALGGPAPLDTWLPACCDGRQPHGRFASARLRRWRRPAPS